jgi:anti-sigma factor RsiW
MRPITRPMTSPLGPIAPIARPGSCLQYATLEVSVTADPPPPAHAPGPTPGDDLDDVDEAAIGKLSDYLDGTLAAAERAEVARKIADDPAWKRAHAELTETRKYLSGLRKAHAPSSFAEDVAETIHQRSAGRFFGRRRLGDRVPFGALLVIALAGLLVIGYVLWASSTGSLKVEHDHAPPAAQGSAAVSPP